MTKSSGGSTIKHGDLVMVAGYIDRVFYVDAWQYVTYYEPDESYSETLYDLTCAHTGEYELAYAEDLAKVCDAAHADDYLMAAPPPETTNMPDIFAIGFELVFSGMNKTKEESEMNRKQERKPTQRELSSQEAEKRKQARKERKEQIDNLLDIRNWNATKYEETSERAYRAKIDEIDAELAKLAAEGRR